MNSSGFSLLEMIIVLSIIAVLLAMMPDMTTETLNTQLADKMALELQQIGAAVEMEQTLSQAGPPASINDLSNILNQDWINNGAEHPLADLSPMRSYNFETVRLQNVPVGVDIVTEIPKEYAHYIASKLGATTVIENGDYATLKYRVLYPKQVTSHENLLHREGDSMYGPLRLSAHQNMTVLHPGDESLRLSPDGEALSIDWGDSVAQNIGLTPLDPSQGEAPYISFKQKEGNIGSRQGDMSKNAAEIGYLWAANRVSDLSGRKILSKPYYDGPAEAVFSILSKRIGDFSGTNPALNDPDINSGFASEEEAESAGFGPRIDFLPFFNGAINDSEPWLEAYKKSLGAVVIGGSGTLVLDSSDIDYKAENNQSMLGSTLFFSDPKIDGQSAADTGDIDYSFEDTYGLSLTPVLTYDAGSIGIERRYRRFLGVLGSNFSVYTKSGRETIGAIHYNTNNGEVYEGSITFEGVSRGQNIGAIRMRGRVSDTASASNRESFSGNSRDASAVFRMITTEVGGSNEGAGFSFTAFLSPDTSVDPFDTFMTEGNIAPGTVMTVDQFNNGERYRQLPGLSVTYTMNGIQVANRIVHQYDRVQFKTDLKIGKYDPNDPNNSEVPEVRSDSYSNLYSLYAGGSISSSATVYGFERQKNYGFIDIQARRFLDPNGEDLSVGVRNVQDHFLACLSADTVNENAESCEVEKPECTVGQIADMILTVQGVYLPEDMDNTRFDKYDTWTFEAWKEDTGNNSWIVHCSAVRSKGTPGETVLPCFVSYAAGCFKP